MNDYNAQYREYAALIEDALPGFLPRTGPRRKPVADAMAYSLLAGGKRVRATLLIASYAMLADDVTHALPFAAAVEMIHAYSLIHDDLPCMDDDDMRRGKPACHIAFGQVTALLAGDALQTLAFETVCSEKNEAFFGAGKVLEAARVLACAAGARGMVGGQIMDLANENRSVDAKTLMDTDARKTGALIAAAVEIGCMLGGADETIMTHAVSYAKNLGLAFQVIDDILDCTAEPDTLGKPVGSDEGKKKTTYVSVFGLSKSREIAAELTDKANRAILKTGLNVEFLCFFADMLTGREY